MSDIFYHALSFGVGLLAGGVAVGGVVSQQLGNRLIAANDKLAETRKQLAEAKLVGDEWYGFYRATAAERDQALAAIDAAEAAAKRGRPARAANGRYTKAA